MAAIPAYNEEKTIAKGLIAVAASLVEVMLLSTAIMLFTLVTVIRERR